MVGIGFVMGEREEDHVVLHVVFCIIALVGFCAKMLLEEDIFLAYLDFGNIFGRISCNDTRGGRHISGSSAFRNISGIN